MKPVRRENGKKTFKCERVVRGKGFIVIEWEIKIGVGDRVAQADIINMYSSCLISEKIELLGRN